jgi:tRNA(fMet)-specific endonuclease VapC
MSLYILDTDTLTLLNWNHAKVLQQVLAHLHDDIAVTVISVEEQLSGWYLALRQCKQTAKLTAIYQRMTDTIESLKNFPIHSFTPGAGQRFDQLQGLKLGVKKMDLRIASIALEAGGIVVTRNHTDFQRVPGLTIEDWSQ